MHWDPEPRTSRRVPPTRCCRRPVGRASLRFLCRQEAGAPRFMESPLAIFAVHWDHELPGGCSAGVLACEFTGRLARCSCWRRDAAATRSRDGCATGFMESPHSLVRMHWDLEPIAIPLTRPSDTLSPIGGEGCGEGVRFMARIGDSSNWICFIKNERL